MLSGAFFIFRMLALTVLVVLLLQFKVGEKTIEFEVHNWIQNSVFVDYVQTSIDGGVKVTKNGYQKLHASVNSIFNRMSRKGGGDKSERGIAVELKRSQQSGYGKKENGEDDDLPQYRTQSQSRY